ncbi:MAG: transcription antitermination factor NusB [Planctomycetota bacterium]
MSASPPSSRGQKRGGRAQQRREARCCALQLLYSYDQKHYEDDGLLVPEDHFAAAPTETSDYAHELFNGYRTERAAIDAIIDERLNNWTLARLAVIDRSLLRLGTYELIYCDQTPMKVIINEYIELAKQYGSEGKTAKLINGVLDRIAREFRKQGG